MFNILSTFYSSKVILTTSCLLNQQFKKVLQIFRRWILIQFISSGHIEFYNLLLKQTNLSQMDAYVALLDGSRTPNPPVLSTVFISSLTSSSASTTRSSIPWQPSHQERFSMMSSDTTPPQSTFLTSTLTFALTQQPSNALPFTTTGCFK